MTGAIDPFATYLRYLDKRRGEELVLSRYCDRISDARLVTFGTGAILTWGVFSAGWLSGWWLSLPVALFIGLAVLHHRLLTSKHRLASAVSWYNRGIARLEDRWSGTGSRGDQFASDHHLFTLDLDLFGEGSLFQLLNTTQTQAGEEILASWLLEPADGTEVATRQEAVGELKQRFELRERLATASSDTHPTIRPSDLTDWATAAPILHGGRTQLAALILSGLTTIAIISWLVYMISPLPMLLMLTVSIAFRRRFHKRINHIMHAVVGPAHELEALTHIGSVFREDIYTSQRLSELRASLATAKGEMPRATRRLKRLVEMYDWQHNLIFRPFAAIAFLELQCAFTVEAWRARHGGSVRKWIRGIGELEALSALGTYAYEHQADPFPELVSSDQTPVYEAKALTHPLIPTALSVANDLTLGTSPQVLIVSGSNMSGKTTLLRSVGISVVMAFMGAPVRASSLRVSPVSIGATLRIEDSLQAGRSRFYAEVLRLGQIVKIARIRPTLFLLDELFHGTNSHDRAEGARSLLEFLLAHHAVGLVTTHDLSLSRIGDKLTPAVLNVHFDDTLVDGEMRFDYRLKPGIVRRSNALAIMRAVGLEVTESEDTTN